MIKNVIIHGLSDCDLFEHKISQELNESLNYSFIRFVKRKGDFMAESLNYSFKLFFQKC